MSITEIQFFITLNRIVPYIEQYCKKKKKERKIKIKKMSTQSTFQTNKKKEQNEKKIPNDID
jgi:hypothetical protein